MPARHGFVQLPHGPFVEERHLRAEDASHRVGYVEKAPYLAPIARSFLTRVVAALRHLPAGPEARLLRPFDAEGRDVLGLTAAPPAELGPDEPRSEEVRRVAGHVRRLSGTSELVLVDAWFESDGVTWRVTEGVDFAVDRGGGESVVVSFGLAPLVIGRPEAVALAEHLDALGSETRRLVPAHLATGGTGQRVRIAAGDLVEVWGVCRGLSDSRRSFDFGGDYRTAPRPARVVGDEDGTRLVIVRDSIGSS